MINQYRQVPEISVVIIAYLRKEYVIQAVQSAINQKLDRERYEIIVIKILPMRTLIIFYLLTGLRIYFHLILLSGQNSPKALESQGVK